MVWGVTTTACACVRVCTDGCTGCLLPSRTLEQRAQRLFGTKGIPLENLDPALFAKSKAAQSKEPERQREVALLEAQVYRYSELLGVRRCRILVEYGCGCECGCTHVCRCVMCRGCVGGGGGVWLWVCGGGPGIYDCGCV